MSVDGRSVSEGGLTRRRGTVRWIATLGRIRHASPFTVVINRFSPQPTDCSGSYTESERFEELLVTIKY